jgi:hypothetical protein
VVTVTADRRSVNRRLGSDPNDPVESEHGCEAGALGDFHVKKIILPSGKAVEIVYFDALGGGDEAAATLAEGLRPDTHRVAAPALEMCPCCQSALVYPIDWREAESDRWELELRCPACEWRDRSTFDQEAVERFDDVLNAATDSLIDTLERVSRDNMRAEIDRFVEALEHDHILPFDF